MRFKKVLSIALTISLLFGTYNPINACKDTDSEAKIKIKVISATLAGTTLFAIPFFTTLGSISIMILKCLENHSKDLSKDLIEKIAQKKYKAYLNQSTCSICLDDMNTENRNDTLVLPCGHAFHKSCITKWFGKNCSCPICRRKFN